MTRIELENRVWLLANHEEKNELLDLGLTSKARYVIQELHEEIDNWRAEYIHLGRELGEIINDQQDIILKLQNENRRIKRENWNLKKTKGRKK